MHRVTKPHAVHGFHSLNTIDKGELQLLVAAGKAAGPSDARERGGPDMGEQTAVPVVREQEVAPGCFSASGCCQAVPVLLVFLFLVMNVGVTTCI